MAQWLPIRAMVTQHFKISNAHRHISRAILPCIQCNKKSPYIQINELTINEPAPPKLIHTFERMTGISLPQKIKNLYLFANGIKCIWSVKEIIPKRIITKIKAEAELPDFDYSQPLGAIRILPPSTHAGK